MKAPRLSLCMIARDEEYFLRRCLISVQGLVDEIIVVDTGSTDQTRSIAGEFTPHVFEFDWIDDFAAARNFSLARASGDWILVLDADELIAESDYEEIAQAIRSPDYDAYFLQQYNYSNNALEKDWQRLPAATSCSGGYAGYRINPICRLFRNHCGIVYAGPVHEVVDASLPPGRYSHLDIPIHHHIDSDPSKPRLERQKNYLRLLAQAVDDDPSGRLHFLAGTSCMYDEDDPAKALNYFEIALERGYEVEASLEGIAETSYRVGHYERAYTIYQQLHEAGRESFSILVNLANLETRAGNYPEAAELLRRLLSLGLAPEGVAGQLQRNLEFLEEKGG